MNRLIASLCAVLFAACHSPEPAYDGASAAGPYEFTGPLFTIGSDEAAGPLLWQPRSITFLGNGNLLVADRDMSLREFDERGTVVREFGRTGAGPGEFRQLTWATPIRGDSVAAYDAELHRVSFFSSDGAHARTVSTAGAGITMVAGISESARLLGFPLPVVRDPTLAEWGRTAVLLVDIEGEAPEADTLMVPIWLRCNPANEQVCAPHPDTDQRRRGVLAAGREQVFMTPADGGVMFVVDFGTLAYDSIPLPAPYVDAVVQAIVPVGHDSAWISLDRPDTRVWLRYTADGGMAGFNPPVDAELRAARGACVAVWRVGPTGAGAVEVYRATDAVTEPASGASHTSCRLDALPPRP